MKRSPQLDDDILVVLDTNEQHRNTNDKQRDMDDDIDDDWNECSSKNRLFSIRILSSQPLRIVALLIIASVLLPCILFVIDGTFHTIGSSLSTLLLSPQSSSHLSSPPILLRRNLVESSTSTTGAESSSSNENSKKDRTMATYDYCRLVNETTTTMSESTTSFITNYYYYYETVQVNYIQSIGMDYLLYMSRRQTKRRSFGGILINSPLENEQDDNDSGSGSEGTLDIIAKGKCDCRSICHHQSCQNDYIEITSPNTNPSCMCLRQKQEDVVGKRRQLEQQQQQKDVVVTESTTSIGEEVSVDDDYYDDKFVLSNGTSTTVSSSTATTPTSLEMVCGNNSYCSIDFDECVCTAGYRHVMTPTSTGTSSSSSSSSSNGDYVGDYDNNTNYVPRGNNKDIFPFFLIIDNQKNYTTNADRSTSNNGQCVDIDECIENNNICNTTSNTTTTNATLNSTNEQNNLICVNLIGSYKCVPSQTSDVDDQQELTTTPPTDVESSISTSTGTGTTENINTTCIDDGIRCIPGSTCNQCCSGNAYNDNGYACGGICYLDGTPCTYGIDCHLCCTGHYSFWYSTMNHTCGLSEPCYEDGTVCIPGVSCSNCCSAQSVVTPMEVNTNSTSSDGINNNGGTGTNSAVDDTSYYQYTTSSDDGSTTTCGVGTCLEGGSSCHFYSTCTRCCSYQRSSDDINTNTTMMDELLSSFVYYNETTDSHYCANEYKDQQHGESVVGDEEQEEEIEQVHEDDYPIQVPDDEEDDIPSCLEDSIPCTASIDCWKCCNGAHEEEEQTETETLSPSSSSSSSSSSTSSSTTVFVCGPQCMKDGQQCTSTFFLPP